MKTKNHPNYDPTFPEKFKWDLIDSIKIYELASKIIIYINQDLKKEMKDRHNIAGLRLVLNILSETELN